MSKVCIEEIMLPSSVDDQNNLIDCNKEETNQENQENQNNQLTTYEVVFSDINTDYIISSTASFCCGIITRYFFVN